MRSTRYSTTRQKACQPCAIAKAKCDRKPESCTRCSNRGLSCVYAQPPRLHSDPDASEEPGISTIFSSPNVTVTNDTLSVSEHEPTTPITGITPISLENDLGSPEAVPIPQAKNQSSTKPAFSNNYYSDTEIPSDHDRFQFFNLDLVCNINADDISNRWLNRYVPIPGQATKNYNPNISAFIHRTLKSYADSAVRGHKVPPFIHPAQITTSISQPLSTCLSVIRICQKPLTGGEEVAIELLQREMTKIYERQAIYDDVASLAAFQAYLIYAMVLFFRLGDGTKAFLRQAMMNLQEIACSTCRLGLTCLAEQQGTRPKWEAWILAEAKRRTLFAMYLFDSALSRQDGLPTFLGTELQGLLAPGMKRLWGAPSRRDWEIKYNAHLADWSDGFLHIEELWPMPSDWEEERIVNRRRRVDLWLENLDEYGTMMYAVTSCTHGG